jgi:hypothetical protein
MASETVTCTHSDRPAVGRGLCGSCYGRWRRGTTPAPVGRRLNRNGNPALIFDVLETDGGWLTIEGIALALPSMKRVTLERALFRLRDRGLVVSRRMLLTTTESRWASITTRDGEVFRTEWRVF